MTARPASAVAGRWVAHISAACAAGTSAQNCSWKRSCVMYRSVVPSARGTGRSASPSVLPGNFMDSGVAASPASGAKPAAYTSPTMSPESAGTFEMTIPP
jgi:hypothetical protein